MDTRTLWAKKSTGYLINVTPFPYNAKNRGGQKMLKLMSEETMAKLLSFSTRKKVAFAMLLYERMIPELHSFSVAERRDFSCFERAREEFWRSLMDDKSSINWTKLREDILDATPDSEDYGSLEASFALNAALVAADIAGFLADGQDSHLVEAVGYARDSLYASASNELETIAYDRAVEDHVNAHPLVKRESRAEEEDVAFLSIMPDGPWTADIFSTLRRRAETQNCLLNNASL
jgi:uncharacterized protein YjaG (DUF416 family)